MRLLQFDVIVVGAGLAGLVATNEIARSGKKVLLLDQEGEQSIGGQAWWSFGGLFLVDSKEQRAMGVKDSLELAWQDWIGTAAYDRPDRKSTRLNSSHVAISYAVFCLKKKTDTRFAMPNT